MILNEAEIHAGVARLAGEIRQRYARRPLTVVAVLTGSVVLLADLIRLLDMPLRVGLIQARSYRSTSTTPGALEIHAEVLPELSGRDVLLVDDIFDTGRTLESLLPQIQRLNPRSLHSAVLLRKQARQQVSTEPDHVGFMIPDQFVVGYGLDFNDEHRNLPYIAALEEHEMDSSGPE